MAMKPYLTNQQKALIDDVRRYLEAFRLNRGGGNTPNNTPDTEAI